MIQMRTMLRVADNSGARRIQCITPIGGGVGLQATIGDVISATVKEADPESKIPKGKVIRSSSGPARRSGARTARSSVSTRTRRSSSTRPTSRSEPVSSDPWGGNSGRESS